jgi:hypothetical protein
MLFHESSDLIHLVIFESPIFYQLNRFQPEFRNLSISLDVNVRRLAGVRAKEDKIVRSILKNGWHNGTRLFALFALYAN